MNKIKLLIFSCFWLMMLPIYAQNVNVKGKVVDRNGEALVGVNIYEKNNPSLGVITDFDGNYTIEVPSNSTVVFSFIGFANQEILVTDQITLNVTLEASEINLNEVVAVGYGTQKKGNLTTAVTQINAKELESRAEPTVAQALQGAVPGLYIKGVGKPGATAEIRLRGSTSLNDKGSPLVLIDGVPGDYNWINPQDIESFTVLKDAASASIYGSRAAHGVILITTKRGKTGKPTFSYNGHVGILTPIDMPETVNSAKWAELRNLSQVNAGEQKTFTDEEIEKYRSGSDLNRYPNTDWFDLLLGNATVTRHSISAQGGNENVNYIVSAGIDSQEGLVDNVEQDIYNMRSAIDIKLNKRMDLSFDFRYTLRETDEVNGSVETFIRELYKMNPTMLAYYTDGSYGYNAWAIPNVIAAFNTAGHVKESRHNPNGIFKFKYNILEGLTFNGIANVDYRFNNRTGQQRKWSLTDYFTKETRTFGTNSLEEQRYHKKYYNLQALLNYKKSLGNHNFDILAGYQQEKQEDNTLKAYRTNYVTDLLTTIKAGPKEDWSNDGWADHWAIASLIGRVNYDYKSKYIASFTIRNDGSSRFSEDNRWSSFKSFSGAWRITGENFAQAITNYVNDFKLRASFGETGAATGLGLYPSYTTLGMGGIVLDNKYVNTAYLNTIGNPNLTWERTKMLDIGFDALAFDSKVNVVFDWYRKYTEDILIKMPVPREYGFGNTPVNIGEIENRGWELQVTYRNQINDWSYSATANISNNKNEVLDLAGTGPWKGDWLTQEGYPRGEFYGYESAGYFTSEEDVANHAFQHNENAPGDIKYVDQITVDTDGDGIADATDGKINGDDRVPLGNDNPHFLYGFKLNVGWKNLDFSAVFQGVGEHKVYVGGPNIQPLTDNGHGPIYKHQLDFWTPDNENAEFPRLLASNKTNSNYWRSDFWLRDAAYFRCKNIVIGYKIPSTYLEKIGLSYARLYVSGSNLFTIDNYVDGYDPEAPGSNTYPLARTIAFGANIKF